MADPELPDPDEAPRARDLLPDEPPPDAPIGEATDKKPAVKAPVPAHGEIASQQQLDEGERAVEEADGGGVDTSDSPTGEADTGREGQGGTGQGTDDETIGSPEVTARSAQAERDEN